MIVAATLQCTGSPQIDALPSEVCPATTNWSLEQNQSQDCKRISETAV
jgi:hypothetical protein